MPTVDWIGNRAVVNHHNEVPFHVLKNKCYPDIVCKLKDGRFLVVEYKGADRWSNDDSKEKRRLGELWALKSGGKCLFVMPKGAHLDDVALLLKRGV